MSGMQNLVKLDFRREGGIVVFTPNNSAKGYVQSGVAKPAPISGKLTMVWEHVTLDNPNIGAQNAIPGLEVISPTWFNLMDANGGMANRARLLMWNQPTARDTGMGACLQQLQRLNDERPVQERARDEPVHGASYNLC